MTTNTGDTLESEIEAFLRRKYFQRADDRQRSMGLSYTTAETRDLAKEISGFVAAWNRRASPPAGEGEPVAAVIAAARNMPRRTPRPGGATTVHTFEIEGCHVWALDRALAEYDIDAAFTGRALPQPTTAGERDGLIWALNQWKCPSCGGATVYTNRSADRGEEKLPCKVCEQTGLHPIARAALASPPRDPETSDREALDRLIDAASHFSDPSWDDRDEVRLCFDGQDIIGFTVGALRALSRLHTSGAGSEEGWQTIDSAPKDGRELLLAFGAGLGDVPPPLVCSWNRREEAWYGVGVEIEVLTPPTHWRNLPPPPAAVSSPEVRGEGHE